MSTIKQLALPLNVQSCHVRGCTAPIVGSSHAKRDGYVCNYHNKIEWATALTHSKDTYWRTFGQRWLAELKREVAS